MDLKVPPSRVRVTRRRVLQGAGLIGLGSVAAAVLAACGAPAAPPTPTAAPPPTAAAAPPTAAAPTPTAAPAATIAPAATTAPAATAAPTTAPAAATKPAGAGTVLDIWRPKYGPENVWTDSYANFESKHGGLKIKDNQLPIDQAWDQKLLTMLAGGLTSDVVYSHPYYAATFRLKGAIIALDDYAKAVDLKDFYPATIGYHSYKGKLHGLSWYSGTWLMYYNTKLLNEAGLTDPWQLYQQKQWTRDKLNEYVAKLTKGSGSDKVFGVNPPYPAPDISSIYIWGEGGDVWNEDISQTVINSDAGVRAFTYLSDLVIKGHAPNKSDVAAFAQQAGGLFGSNKVGLNECAKYCVGRVWGEAPVAQNVGMVPYPVWPTGKEYSVDGADGFGVCATSKMKDVAFEMVYQMATDLNQRLVAASFSAPSTRTVANSPAWKSGMRPWEKVEVYDISASNVRAPVCPPGFQEIRKLIMAAFDQMTLKQVTVKQGLDTLKPQIDGILKEQGAYGPGDGLVSFSGCGGPAASAGADGSSDCSTAS